MAVKVFVFLLGVFATFSYQSLALTQTESDFIYNDQLSYYQKTNTYYPEVIDDTTEIHTYETLCKGYIVVETKENEVVGTAFGENAEKMSYIYETKQTYSSTTKDYEIPPVDIIVASTSEPI